MRRYRFRQLVLFVAVLLLPGTLIFWSLRHIAQREHADKVLDRSRKAHDARQLELTRQEEDRQRVVNRVGQTVGSSLEKTRLLQIANARLYSVERPADFGDDAVVVVAVAAGTRLALPCDIAPQKVPDLIFHVPDADRAVKSGDKVAARELYRQKIRSASDKHDERQVAATSWRYAKFLEDFDAFDARDESLAIYRGLLSKSLGFTDDIGRPFAFYASERMVPLGFGREVLKRLQEDIECPVLEPSQTAQLKEQFEQLISSEDPELSLGARRALHRLSAREGDLNRTRTAREIRRFQQDFTNLHLTEAWKSYDADGSHDLWLVSQAQVPGGADDKPLVIAVRAETIRQRAVKETGQSFALSASGRYPLDKDRLPDLKADLPPSDSGPALAPTEEPEQLSLFLELLELPQSLRLMFAVVLALSALAAALLWRDVLRESHVAELRTQFVSSVSHELKTPLTSIRMFAELMQINGTSNPKHAGFLQIIVNESERLTRLLNNVLDFSRIERGQKIYRRESVSLSKLVDATVRTIQHPLNEQGFRLNVKIVDELPPVFLDPDAIQQAILNLLTNAMKYSGASREIDLILCKENGNALIQVSDNGIGISRKDQARIFEKYYRARIPENREISGTGLGLALVVHIAEAHGGSVGVESKPGAGSTFSIHLPLKGSTTT